MVTRTPGARGERGQVLIMTAFALVTLLGITALSVDAAFMYDKRNRLFAAADAAAKSAAIEVHRNASINDAHLRNFAEQQVTAHGFTPAACGSATNAAICVNHPPTSGTFTGNAAYVEVIVSEQTSTFFGTVLGWAHLTPGARSVAGPSPGPSCIVTLTGDLTIGNGTVTMPTCDAAVAGNLNLTHANSSIEARSIGVTGVCIGANCGSIQNLHTGAPLPTDPLASRLTFPAEPDYGPCLPAIVTGSSPHPVTIPLVPACYKTISIGNKVTIAFGAGNYKFEPDAGQPALTTTANGGEFVFGAGQYYVKGPMDFGGKQVSLSGSGVVMFLRGDGRISVPNNSDVSLSAPTAGAYSGILWYQDSSDVNAATFDSCNGNGVCTYSMSGAFYFPGAPVTFLKGVDSTNLCTLIVAASLSIDGGNNHFSNPCAPYSGSPLLTVSTAE